MRDPVVQQKLEECTRAKRALHKAQQAETLAEDLYGNFSSKHLAAKAAVLAADTAESQAEKLYKAQIEIARRECVARARVVLCTISTAARSLLSD